MSRLDGMKKIAGVASMLVATIVFAATPSHALEIKRMTLSTGATLRVSEEHRLPMVTVEIGFDAGTRRDPVGKEGLAELTARSLSQGTKDLTAPEFDQKVDFMGSSVAVSAGRDYATGGMTTPKKDPAQKIGVPSGIPHNPGRRRAGIPPQPAGQTSRIKTAGRQTGR